MKRYSLILFLVAFCPPLFAQFTIELFYEQDAIIPDEYSQINFNSAVFTLYDCDSISVTVNLTQKARKSSSPDELLAARENKLRQLFQEENFKPNYLMFERRYEGIKLSDPDVIIKGFGERPSLANLKKLKKDTLIINDAGWRVRCYVKDAFYAKSTRVEKINVYDYLLQANAHAVLNGKKQLDISGMYRIHLHDSAVGRAGISIQIPIDEKLNGRSLLLQPHNGQFTTYLKGKSKAKSKAVQQVNFLSVPVIDNTTIAVASVIETKQPVQFVLPSEFTFIEVEMKSTAPDNYTRAVISDSEVLARFDITSASERVEFKFLVQNLSGQYIFTDWVTVEDLRKKFGCKEYKSAQPFATVMLNRSVFVEPQNFANYEKGN